MQNTNDKFFPKIMLKMPNLWYVIFRFSLFHCNKGWENFKNFPNVASVLTQKKE
jgi:hypothetical protein